MVWGVGLCLLKSNFAFAENSTEIFGDPLEGTSVWIWNNTGLVREDRLGCFSSFGCSNLSFCVCSGKYGPGPVTGSKILVRALAGKNQSFPKLVSDLMCANDLKREVTISLSVASAASERHMVVPHQDGVPEVQRRAGGEGLRVRPRHHPHVLHPVLWHLHLLHVSEEVQDQPVLPHNCELTCPQQLGPLFGWTLTKSRVSLRLHPGQEAHQRLCHHPGHTHLLWSRCSGGSGNSQTHRAKWIQGGLFLKRRKVALSWLF